MNNIRIAKELNKIAKDLVANLDDAASVVMLFVGDKKSAISKLSRVEPFTFPMKTKEDIARYNKLFDEFYRDLNSVIEKYRKKFEG